MRALSLALEQEGVKPRPRLLSNGKAIAAGRFMVGPLAHLLKNRFYIGEIAYRGEIHKGEHEAILDHGLFDQVQDGLAERAVARTIKRANSSSLLIGKIFDDRGNAMSPTHANKRGARYRYYVSHALLQNRKSQAGTVARVSAPDVEAIVAQAIRSKARAEAATPDRALLQTHLERVTVHPRRLDIQLLATGLGDREAATPPDVLSLPFTPRQPCRKGLAHAPGAVGTIDAESRDTLLQAIARARRWMEAILSGQVSSTDEIAASEHLAERHVRFLLPLAFVSPRIVTTIVNGSAPADLTVSSLARALPHAWAEQERRLDTV